MLKKSSLIFFGILLSVSVFQAETLTREIRFFPPLIEFRIDEPTQIAVELPLDTIFNFQISNGRTLISGTNYSLIAEQHAVNFNFEENLLIVNIEISKDIASVQQRTSLFVTNSRGQILHQPLIGSTIFINGEQPSIGSFRFNTFRLTGHFEGIVIDMETGKTTNLLESTFPQKGKLIFRALTLGN